MTIFILSVIFIDKADKKAQRERELKMEREQIEREEEIKELSLKMRRKYVSVSFNILVMQLINSMVFSPIS